MAAYSSGKIAWLRFLASFSLASGAAVLFLALFAGPRLGLLYDFLLRRRPALPVSPELLIIDSSVSGGENGPAAPDGGAAGSAPGGELGADILEPGAASSLLYAMAEFGAQTLIIQVPVLGLPAGGAAGEEEILGRFDEEFSLLSRNIRNLFDAIRTGSVDPRDAAGYVGELVELSEQGKERLVSALIRREEEGVGEMERAAAFFGGARRPGDLRVQLIRSSGSRAGEGAGVLAERDEYSRARPDGDGVLRRVAPVLRVPDLSGNAPGGGTREHIVYGALKARYAYADIETAAPAGFFGAAFQDFPVLALKGGAGGRDSIIPLDRNGAVLFELPRGGEGFRRMGIADVLAYDEADRQLGRLLAEGEARGIYQGVEGENQPGILYDFALSLKEELAASPSGAGEEGKRRWIESRRRYFKSLEDFLYGPAEMELARGYEELLASEGLAEGSRAEIAEMRDSLLRTFSELREKHKELLDMRAKLESALAGSFCALGPGSAGLSRAGESLRAPSRPRDFPGWLRTALMPGRLPSDAEVSALLANSVLTGRAVIPGEGRLLFLGSLLSAFLVCFSVKSLRPAAALGIGSLLILLLGTGFAAGFVLSGVWLDPRVPAAACAAGLAVSYMWALIASSRHSRRFRLAFGPFVSRDCLKRAIAAGAPLPSRILAARAAVVAVKNAEPRAGGGSAGIPAGAAALADSLRALAFQEKAAEFFKKAGGTVIGAEGDMVCGCFGSPLERAFFRGRKEASPYEGDMRAKTAPAARAAEFVAETAARAGCESWQFGLDMGVCNFAWTALAGYFALGVPVQKAKALSRLAGRYKARAAISVSVNEALPDLAAKKLDAFKDPSGAPGEPFYRLDL